MSDLQGFSSPEQAAMFGFPERYCRIVAYAVHGDDAFVLLDTGSDGHKYLYGVRCARRDGQWHDNGSSNVGGWSVCGPDPELGLLALFDEAPKAADAVRLCFNGELQDVAVKDGAYLATWWSVPCPAFDGWPTVEAFWINGVWSQVGARR